LVEGHGIEQYLEERVKLSKFAQGSDERPDTHDDPEEGDHGGGGGGGVDEVFQRVGMR